MKRSATFLSLLFLFLASISPREPLTADFKESASYRWLNKPVLDSRLLDDMEDLTHWTAFTTGGPAVVDARVVSKIEEVRVAAKIDITTDNIHHGKQALRMRTPTKLEGPGPANGRHWGRSGIRRHFDGEDWTKFNRLSIWIYPDLPGFYTAALDFRIFNDGKEKLPALFGQEGETSLIVRNHEWNHVVWEIGNVARDKVTAFEASYGLSGNMPEEADSILFYFDQFDLERVEPDKIEGWDVWPGRISYSHAGYQTGAVKQAIASGLTATTFRVVDQNTGEVALSKPIQTVTTPLGTFQCMDFSALRLDGMYTVEAGSLTTQPFRIGGDAWESSIWKALNFFYAERCGMEVPGVHSVCHKDWVSVHDDKRIVINGGWHDAGDLTQGLGNTAEIDYGLFSLAERLRARHEHPALYARVVEEARWGLDWILKTTFGDGYRNSGSISSRRTNNILGDFDDIIAKANSLPMTSFQAAAVEALAYRVLKDEDPRLANYALRTAEADWNFGVAAMANIKPSKDIWSGSFDSNNVEHELTSQAILAAVDLWKATGKAVYQEKAVAWSKTIYNAQQRSRTDWDVPLTGFFYATTAKDRILHYCHRGREQGPVLALTALCSAFPDHGDWMKWYAAVTLHAEYQKTVSQYTAPYHVLPASIYKDDEYIGVPESRRESFRKQVLQGVPLGKGHYLRLFPVWMDYRGHFGTILPQAQALSSAAWLRNDLASAQLAEQQLEWIIGKNPFSQSTMWGEGHDFAPLYTPSSGDMVGALPVGIQTRGDNDAPYWPAQNTWTYKEIWVHPVARWVWLLRDLYGPSLIEGQASAPITLTARNTQAPITITPDALTGRFRAMVPEGEYTLRSGNESRTQTLLPGASYTLDLRPGRTLIITATSATTSKGEVSIRATVQGSGIHNFQLRTDNLALSSTEKQVTLKPGTPLTIEWKARTPSPNTPWVAVLVPDGDLAQRQELTGSTWQK